MIYKILRQISAPYPVLDKPWDLICWTEDEADQGHYDRNKIVLALTGETLARQSDKGIWWKAISDPSAFNTP